MQTTEYHFTRKNNRFTFEYCVPVNSLETRTKFQLRETREKSIGTESPSIIRCSTISNWGFFPVLLKVLYCLKQAVLLLSRISSFLSSRWLIPYRFSSLYSVNYSVNCKLCPHTFHSLKRSQMPSFFVRNDHQGQEQYASRNFYTIVTRTRSKIT